MNNRENHLIVSLCVHPARALVFRFVLALPQDSPCVVICWQDTLVIIWIPPVCSEYVRE